MTEAERDRASVVITKRDYNNIGIRHSQWPVLGLALFGKEVPMTCLRLICSRIDRFLAAILLTVGLACVMPARGEAAVAVGWLTDGAIALLFFMHGAQLSPEAAFLG